MNLFIILAVTALCNGAKLDRTYLPPNAQTSGGTGSILQTPLSEQPLQNQISRKNPLNGFTNTGNQIEASGFGPIEQNVAFNGNQNSQYQELNNFDSKPERAQAAFERNAAILRQSNENDGERYSYAYETENGIYAEEKGVATDGVEAEGGFSYTGDDGIVYSIRYTADQNGFVPQGEHLPTPPPVPEEILKALEQNARDEAAGIYDDGSYNEAKYANEESRGYDFNANNKYTNAKNQANNDAIILNAAGLSGPSTNLVMSEFGRNSFVNNAPSQTYENAIDSKIDPSFVPNKPSFGNNTPFSSNTPVFGNNSPSIPNVPSFGANTPPVGSNVPTISAPAIGRSGQTPAYGPLTPNTAALGFNRAVPSETSASFGQRTFAISATSDRVDPEKAYLPPFQRSASQNGFGRIQSFSERNGYRY